MTEFDEGVALAARPDDQSTFDTRLGEGWQIGAGVNGGLLLAVMGNALRTRFADDGHADPVAVSAYYLSASRPGPAVLRTEVLRRGRSMSTGQVSLFQEQDGRPVERV
ncbi:MAG: acyl-CoA thioesterase domain-containing protein, partial [Actinomycetes bacterium]